MKIIKGNLTVNEGDKLRIEPLLRQAQNRASSETSSELITDKEIVAFADLKDYDTTNATILEGNQQLTYEDLDELTVVTGDVMEIGGEYAS